MNLQPGTTLSKPPDGFGGSMVLELVVQICSSRVCFSPWISPTLSPPIFEVLSIGIIINILCIPSIWYIIDAQYMPMKSFFNTNDYV